MLLLEWMTGRLQVFGTLNISIAPGGLSSMGEGFNIEANGWYSSQIPQLKKTNYTGMSMALSDWVITPI